MFPFPLNVLEIRREGLPQGISTLSSPQNLSGDKLVAPCLQTPHTRWPAHREQESPLDCCTFCKGPRTNTDFHICSESWKPASLLKKYSISKMLILHLNIHHNKEEGKPWHSVLVLKHNSWYRLFVICCHSYFHCMQNLLLSLSIIEVNTNPPQKKVLKISIYGKENSKSFCFVGCDSPLLEKCVPVN